MDNKIITWTPIGFLVLSQLKELLDPEYPIELVNLGILKIEKIENKGNNWSQVTLIGLEFLPTYGQCKMAPLLGITLFAAVFKRWLILLVMKIKNKRWLVFYKIKVSKKDHHSGEIITQQLNDQERLSAALENTAIRLAILNCTNSNQVQSRLDLK